MKPTPQRLILLAAGLALLAGLAYAFVPRPIPVDVATVQCGPLQVTVDEDGKTRIKERYIVSAPLAGRLLRLELHPGDAVEAGQTLLATLEPADPQLLDPRARAQAEARVKAAAAARQQAEPPLERARTTHEFARAELERTKSLYRAQAVPLQELDNAKEKERVAAEEFKSAQFAVQIADYELELARAALLRTQPESFHPCDDWQFPLLSPIRGRVLRVFQESSTVVAPGAPLLEVGDPGDLEVEIDVLSADAVKIQPGAKVYLEHWGGDAPLLGRVRVVEPAGFLKISALGVEEQRVNVIVAFVDPPEKRGSLGDAYRVEARIIVWEAQNVMKLPIGALFREGEDWAAFAVAGGRARLARVTLGHRNDLEAEVLAGVAERARVIVHPGDRIRNGVRVRLR